tara:strand:- start:145 stop:786 length:642 start_codon:yes stop_codon:yes gene_type:complete
MNGKNGSVNLEAFLAGTADGVSAVDSDGVIVAWNAAAERILGHRANEVVGRLCGDVLDARDAAGNLACSEFCTVRNHAKRCEPVHHFKLKTKTSAGDPIWLDVSGVTLGWGPDASVSWILLFRDLTASHEIESNVEEKTTTSPPRVNQPSPGKLTRRELQILWFMKEGAATATIADRLSISRSTVRNHIQNIFKKLDVHSCLEAVAVANRCGL